MTEPSPIRIATRGSALALAQANMVMGLCQAACGGVRFELRIIKTTGDKLQTASLANSELPKGLFTKEIEDALCRNEADMAVHSLKDLPTQLPPGLLLGAVLEREDVRDVLVGKPELPGQAEGSTLPFEVRFEAALDWWVSEHKSENGGIANAPFLPPGATVATSSTRRRAQLLNSRPDFNIIPIRGNVDTRLRKVKENPDLHATVLAAAGLKRLGFEISPNGQLLDNRSPDKRPAAPAGLEGLRAMYMDPAAMLPCVGQAAIGIEARADDSRVAPILSILNHQETLQCVLAERAFLAGMGGGCQLAVAALGQIRSGVLHLRAVSFLGATPRRGEASGPPDQGETIGRQLAAQLAPTLK